LTQCTLPSKSSGGGASGLGGKLPLIVKQTIA
jgi:hypothetical protein